MHKGYALSTAAVLSLTALLHSSTCLTAASPPPKPGTILTVVGNGTVGFSGDGGPATQSAVNAPLGMAVDAAGNLFFADSHNARVRKVSPDGTITTVAGGGTKGPAAAEGGPAPQARLGQPTGVTLDAAGNLFVSDFQTDHVWKVSPSGLITNYAGSGRHGFSGDGGPATQASLMGADGLRVDSSGNLFIADYDNNRVRKVSPDSTISTVAGGGNPADGLGDGGPATQARLKLPVDVALDRAGNLFITDFQNNRVRMVRPDGIILTVAGGGNPPDGLGDGGLATEARLDGIDGMAVDGGGNLFVVDHYHDRVRKIGPAGIITTVAGTGQLGFSGDGGPATEAELNAPAAVALDRAGNLYICDSANQYDAHGDYRVSKNNRIREVFGVTVPD